MSARCYLAPRVTLAYIPAERGGDREFDVVDVNNSYQTTPQQDAVYECVLRNTHVFAMTRDEGGGPPKNAR